MRAVVQKELGHYDAAIADAERFIALSPQSGESATSRRRTTSCASASRTARRRRSLECHA
jgi:regulator of sirC expression with transglutaminase-like and TPR domain